MSEDKTPRIQFLHDEARRAKDAVERELARKKAREESEKLQETLHTATLGLDEMRAGIVDEVISIMQERDKYRVKADLYDEAYRWFRNAGYWYPSAVAYHPTVLEMGEELARHRSGIQGFLETALEHLGVSREERAKLRAGDMREFYEKHKGALDRNLDVIKKAIEPHLPKPWNDEDSEDNDAIENRILSGEFYYDIVAQQSNYKHPPDYRDLIYRKVHGKWRNHTLPKWVKERGYGDTELDNAAMAWEMARMRRDTDESRTTLATMRAATTEVQEKLATVLKAEEADTKTSWGAITALATKRVEEIDYWKSAHDKATEEIDDKTAMLHTLQAAYEKEQQKVLTQHDHIEDMKEQIKVLKDQDETEAGTWKGHYYDLCRHFDIPRPIVGGSEDPNVAEVSGFVGKYYAPLNNLQQRVLAIESQLGPSTTEEMLRRDMKKVEQWRKEVEKATSNVWECCGKTLPIAAQFCPTCGADNTGKIICDECQHDPDARHCQPDPACADFAYEEESAFADPKFALSNKATR